MKKIVFETILAQKNFIRIYPKANFSVLPSAKSRKSSHWELLYSLIISKSSSLQKLAFFLKIFVFAHISAFLLNFLTMTIQEFLNKFCFISPNCVCTDDFAVKFFVLLKSLSTIWIFQVYMISHSFFCLKIASNRKFLKFFYFSVSFSMIAFFHLPEPGNSNLIFIKIHSGALLVFLLFCGIFLVLMKFKFYVAINSVVILGMKLDNWGGWVLIFNYMCAFWSHLTRIGIFLIMFSIMSKKFSKKMSKNRKFLRIC